MWQRTNPRSHGQADALAPQVATCRGLAADEMVLDGRQKAGGQRQILGRIQIGHDKDDVSSGAGARRLEPAGAATRQDRSRLHGWFPTGGHEHREQVAIAPEDDMAEAPPLEHAGVRPDDHGVASANRR